MMRRVRARLILAFGGLIVGAGTAIAIAGSDRDGALRIVEAIQKALADEAAQ